MTRRKSSRRRVGKFKNPDGTVTKRWGAAGYEMEHTYKKPEAKEYTAQCITPDMENKWVVIGYCGVDSGRLLIMDPCYRKNLPEDKEDGIIWDSDIASMIQYNYDLGHAGLGVSFATGIGDGCYPVYGKIKNVSGANQPKDLRITEIKIKLM